MNILSNNLHELSLHSFCRGNRPPRECSLTAAHGGSPVRDTGAETYPATLRCHVGAPIEYSRNPSPKDL